MPEQFDSAFVARVEPELLQSRSINAGGSRLGGEPLFLSTQIYDRSQEAGR